MILEIQTTLELTYTIDAYEMFELESIVYDL